MQSATSTDGKARAVMFDAYAAKHESSLCMGFIASKNQLCYLRQIASASVPRNGQPLETLNCERRNDVAERAALLQHEVLEICGLCNSMCLEIQEVALKQHLQIVPTAVVTDAAHCDPLRAS